MTELPFKIGNDYRLRITPLATKLKLAAVLGQDVTINATGAASLANVLEETAYKLDVATATFRALEEED